MPEALAIPEVVDRFGTRPTQGMFVYMVWLHFNILVFRPNCSTTRTMLHIKWLASAFHAQPTQTVSSGYSEICLQRNQISQRKITKNDR